MFESSSKSRKSWNGRQMIWQCIQIFFFLNLFFDYSRPQRATNKGLSQTPQYNPKGKRWKWLRGCHDEEKRCLRWYVSWNERCKIGWLLLKLEQSESNHSNFKANSAANRKPMQIRKDRCDATEPRFLCDHSSKSILDTLKASQIWNGCASQERVAEIKSGANYCCSYGWF